MNTGQEENLYAKRNYEKYLLALKNSGLVSVEDKGSAGTGAADSSAGAGTGALGLLGNTLPYWLAAFIYRCMILLHIFFFFVVGSCSNFFSLLGATAALSPNEENKEVSSK